MSKGRIFKEIEKKNGGCLYFVMSWSAELSKAFDLKNLCYCKISLVMLLRAKT